MENEIKQDILSVYELFTSNTISMNENENKNKHDWPFVNKK